MSTSPTPEATGKKGRKARAKDRKRRERAGDPCICRCLSLHASHIQAAAAAGCGKVKEAVAFYGCKLDCEECRGDVKRQLRKAIKATSQQE